MSTKEPKLYEELHVIQREIKILRERVTYLENKVGRKEQRRRTYILPIQLEADETGGYVVTSDILPGLVTEGDAYQESLMNAREAAEGLLEVMLEDGDKLPLELYGYQPGDHLNVIAAVPKPA